MVSKWEKTPFFLRKKTFTCHGVCNVVKFPDVLSWLDRTIDIAGFDSSPRFIFVCRSATGRVQMKINLIFENADFFYLWHTRPAFEFPLEIHTSGRVCTIYIRDFRVHRWKTKVHSSTLEKYWLRLDSTGRAPTFGDEIQS